jgi:hypothetical protein
MTKLNNDSSRFTLGLRIGATVILSILIPLITEYAVNRSGTNLFTAYESIALGIFIFLVATTTTIAFEVNRLLAIRNMQQELWIINDTVDTTLNNIRARYLNLIHDRPYNENLIAQYYYEVLDEISEKVHIASTKREVSIDQRTFGLTELLLKIVEQRGHDTIRLIEPINGETNSLNFSTWAKMYYQELTRIASENKDIVVRRLYVYKDRTDIEDQMIQRLFAFHASNDGYEFRILSQDEWIAIVKGRLLSQSQSTFGVWGDFVVYVGIRSSSSSMEGIFMDHPQQIARFRNAFDAGWKLATIPLVQADVPVSLEELFN